VNLARTMAINSLIAGRIFYLLRLANWSQLIKWMAQSKTNVDIPAIGFGIVGAAVILQIIFSHVSLINDIFHSTSELLNQWLPCLAVNSPMIIGPP